MRNHLFKALFFLSEEMHEAGHEASSSAFICGVFASVGRPADDGRTVHLRRILVDFSSDSSIVLPMAMTSPVAFICVLS